MHKGTDWQNLSNYVSTELVTRQPNLYVLAKTQKNKIPISLCPAYWFVASATGCYNFSLAKFVTSLMSCFCYVNYCVQNADEFMERLSNFRDGLPSNAEITEVSYDEKSLSMNIPVKHFLRTFFKMVMFIYSKMLFSLKMILNRPCRYVLRANCFSLMMKFGFRLTIIRWVPLWVFH